MDPLQKKFVDHFSEIAKQERDPTKSAGRNDSERDKEKEIWQDILKKLKIPKKSRVMDIGCGFGDVTKHCLNTAKEEEWSLTLVDIPDVITAIKNNFPESLVANTTFYSGIFPLDMEASFFERKYDAIILYSVLQCTAEPKAFLEKLVPLLGEGGVLLIGDLPNVNKKGRFLTSEFGRKFEANYKGVPENQLPVYLSHQDYAEKVTNQNREICDEFILWMLSTYRREGFQVFVLPQDESLPYSHTREDVIIFRP